MPRKPSPTAGPPPTPSPARPLSNARRRSTSCSAWKRRRPVLTGTEKILVSLSRKDNPQAVISAFRQRMSTLADFPADGPRRWLALYEVRDPGNLGTVIRTADAAGCDGVILIGQTCDPFSVEAVRASMGSLFADAARHRRLRGVQRLAHRRRRPHDRRLDARHARPRQGRLWRASVILMGNEQSGLPPKSKLRATNSCASP